VEELERADAGEDFFLEMTVTRNVSILPERRAAHRSRSRERAPSVSASPPTTEAGDVIVEEEAEQQQPPPTVLIEKAPMCKCANGMRAERSRTVPGAVVDEIRRHGLPRLPLPRRMTCPLCDHVFATRPWVSGS